VDTQLTEIFGRNRLENDLLQSDVEVATPVRDRGIDLIAYLDLDEQAGRFMAIRIQIKAAARRSFTIDQKYAKFQNLLMATGIPLPTPRSGTTAPSFDGLLNTWGIAQRPPQLPVVGTRVYRIADIA